jgi:hypothetical protein
MSNSSVVIAIAGPSATIVDFDGEILVKVNIIDLLCKELASKRVILVFPDAIACYCLESAVLMELNIECGVFEYT